jgi:hypothetical protein
MSTRTGAGQAPVRGLAGHQLADGPRLSGMEIARYGGY